MVVVATHGASLNVVVALVVAPIPALAASVVLDAATAATSIATVIVDDVASSSASTTHRLVLRRASRAKNR